MSFLDIIEMFSYVPNNILPHLNHKKENIDQNNLRGILGKRNLEDFTKSAIYVPNDLVPARLRSDLCQSIHIIPTSTGRYIIQEYPSKFPFQNALDSVSKQSNSKQTYSRQSQVNAKKKIEELDSRRFLESQKQYKHNIQRKFSKFQENNTKDDLSTSQSPSTFISSTDHANVSTDYANYTSIFECHKGLHDNRGGDPDLETTLRVEENPLTCSCQHYHSHILLENSFMDSFRKTPVVERTPSDKSSLNSVSMMAEIDNNLNICNTFWRPYLSFHPYKYGDPLVDFCSLWPTESDIRELLQEGVQATVLRKAVLDVCKLALRCGPVRLLKCLVEMALVRVDQQFENGSGMLHLACIARNCQAVHYLIQAGISHKIRDKYGNTAVQVCVSSQIRKMLPAKFQSPVKEQRTLLIPSLQDKDTIFSMAKSAKHLDDLQKKLQVFSFDVNRECDNQGDYLIHLLVKGGLPQLSYIMLLVKIQGADIDLCNSNGQTPVMVAAYLGDCILCEILMCVLGANPNKPNPHNGRCALHYAILKNNVDVVNCLIKRGADFNLEDNSGCRPDDLPISIEVGSDDCRELIKVQRVQRMEDIIEIITKGTIMPAEMRVTDLFVTDTDGQTLIMAAAQNNNVDNLETLLEIEGAPVDAQDAMTLRTALALAAKNGHFEAVRILLSHDANPVIGDINGYLPLHHAVLNNHESVIDTFLEFFPKAYTGLFKALRWCKKNSIHAKIKAAFDRRQEEIVNPELFDCALTGNDQRLFCFLEEGDGINPKSGVGNWPLYLAVENGHMEVIKLLYEKGGDIRRRHATTGCTVLHVAAKMGRFEIMQFLSQFCRQVGFQDVINVKHSHYKELDINAMNADNKTALQLAAEKGYMKIVKMLLSYGATAALLDDQGWLFTFPEYEGVRIMIEKHRGMHIQQIMKCICDKKGLPVLKQIWLSKFDHNLRDSVGDTPLMVACRIGSMNVVQFLLESAVYRNDPIQDDEEESDIESFGDSGAVLEGAAGSVSNKSMIMDTRSVCSETIYSPGNPFVKVPPSIAEQSNAASQESNETSKKKIQKDSNIKSVSDPATLPDMKAKNSQRLEPNQLQLMLRDVDKPKGLSIFHDGVVSHVCAVNLLEGSTPLHRAMEKGDNLAVVAALIQADSACINMQNHAGLTPIHLACKLARRKTVEKLLNQPDVDLNVRTLDGRLPEEMTSRRGILKIMQKSREEHPLPPQIPLYPPQSSHDSPSSVEGTTVNFDKLYDRYEALKQKQ